MSAFGEFCHKVYHKYFDPNPNGERIPTDSELNMRAQQADGDKGNGRVVQSTDDPYRK